MIATLSTRQQFTDGKLSQNFFSHSIRHIHTFTSDESIDWINLITHQIFFFLIFSAELKMDVLREREVKDSLERQLTEEQKLRGEHLVRKFF